MALKAKLSLPLSSAHATSEGDSFKDLHPRSSVLSFYASYVPTVKQEKGVSTQDFEATIKPGKEWEAFQLERSGAIRGIIVHVANKESDWSELKWEMTWDDVAEEGSQVQVLFDRYYNSWDVNESPFSGYHLEDFKSKEGAVTA